MLSCFSLVQLFATPCTVAYQVPLSMGFSRQEYGNGLPFPLQEIFPTQGSNLHFLPWRWTPPLSHQRRPRVIECVCTKSLQLWTTLSNPMYCSLPGSSVHGIFQARILEWVARGLLLFQGLFLTQGLNPCQDWTHVSYTAGSVFTAEPWGEALM